MNEPRDLAEHNAFVRVPFPLLSPSKYTGDGHALRSDSLILNQHHHFLFAAAVLDGDDSALWKCC